MSVSRSTTNVDVVAMVGTIVLKEAEYTSGNVKRWWQGSNRLRVVVKPKYHFHFQWQFSTRQAKRLRLISSTEQKEMVLVYYWDEKIRYKWNLIFSRQCYQVFRFITLTASTNCSRRKRNFFFGISYLLDIFLSSIIYNVVIVLFIYLYLK